MKIIDKIIKAKDYFTTGVWKETRNTFGVSVVKTLNLSVVAFTNRSLQSKAMSLTYSTVLALVPALALMVAIARGFNLQNLIESELYQMFPAQHTAIATAMKFVDSYLTQATQGVFVGVGIVFLLWTLVSLLSSVDEVFNQIWNIRQSRSMYQKITDYIALCLVIPILMMCSAGVSIFISTIASSASEIAIFTPLVDLTLDALPFVFAWLAFTLCYFLIPNTKVNFKYAAIAGGFAAIGFTVLQALFVNGQIYVSKYNAIYGSFAFLPLLLIWMQFSWLILLSGCVLANSMQNIFSFNYHGDVGEVSHDYLQTITIAVMAIIIKRFESGEHPLTRNDISAGYNLPISILTKIIDKLHNARLIYLVMEDNHEIGLAPAVDNDCFTVNDLICTLNSYGDKDFIPYFSQIFEGLIADLPDISSACKAKDSPLLRDLPIPTMSQAKELMDKNCKS